MTNGIMQKSLTYQNYLNAKRKADIEDGFNWTRTEVPLPKYERSKVKKDSPGWMNFMKDILLELRP